MQLYVIEKKVITKIRREKVENFTLNPYVSGNFTVNTMLLVYPKKMFW